MNRYMNKISVLIIVVCKNKLDLNGRQTKEQFNETGTDINLINATINTYMQKEV